MSVPDLPDVPDEPEPTGWRVARTIDVALTLLGWGFVIGLAAVAMHQWWWGLVLGAGATLVTAYALEPGWVTRLPYAAGWVVPVVLAMVPRPEGDYAVAGDGYGYSLVGIGMVLIVLTTATLPLGRRVAPAHDSDEAVAPTAGSTAPSAIASTAAPSTAQPTPQQTTRPGGRWRPAGLPGPATRKRKPAAKRGE